MKSDLAEPAHAALPPVRRIGMVTMLAYGVGAVAYGVKDFGFLTFLLLFYNQVIGLPADQVGLAILCALLLDAFIDPAIGFLSDRTRSRWGRRHPWMVAAAIPIAIGWLLLWNPPALSHGAMLLWVFATAVFVRSAVSAYEVPSLALTPEFTADYDERTRIMAWRYLFGWAGGMGMMVAAYAWFLAPGPGQEAGQFSRGGYPGFAIGGAVAMVATILISAFGTRREIDKLPRAEIAPSPLGQGLRELWQTLGNRAFLILMAAGLCYYTAQGISYSISNYLYAYVWHFNQLAYLITAPLLLGGAAIALVVAPRVAKRTGKPVAAMAFMAAAAILQALPYLLRLAGLFPPLGDPRMLPLLFALFLANAVCSISSTLLGSSMMADVVELSEIETGRRSEGVFFAGSFFVQKCTSGIGIYATSLILTLARFPENAVVGTVPASTIDRLTILFVTAYMVLGFVAAACYRWFPFGKTEHDARIARLASLDPLSP